MTLDIHAIASRTKICTLRTGAWRPTRLHKGETARENARHGTGDAAKVLVRVCDHPALAELATIHAAAYETHVRLTQPSVQDGMRLLPVGREWEHSQAMAGFQAQHGRLTAQFCADYDTQKAAAPARLNGLYDERFWPGLDIVAQRFRLETQYLPCPTDGAWGEWLSISVRAAQDELSDRLASALRRVAERCASDGKLYQTVFGNLKELLDLIPDLNLADDPRIHSIARAAAALGALDAERVKKSPSLRARTAAEADRLASIFGGAPSPAPASEQNPPLAPSHEPAPAPEFGEPSRPMAPPNMLFDMETAFAA